MLPIVDKPAIQYVIEEAVMAGISDVLVVTGRGKRAIEDHFDRAPELEGELERTGKLDLLELVRETASLAKMHYVRQGEALGLGHAVSVAEPHVGDEPFAVLLGDDVMIDDAALLSGMIAAATEKSASVVALREVPLDEVTCLRLRRRRRGHARRPTASCPSGRSSRSRRPRTRRPTWR